MSNSSPLSKDLNTSSPPLDHDGENTPLLQCDQFAAQSPDLQLINTPVFGRPPDVQIYDSSESSPLGGLSVDLSLHTSMVPGTDPRLKTTALAPPLNNFQCMKPAAPIDPFAIPRPPKDPRRNYATSSSSRTFLSSVSLRPLSASSISHGGPLKPAPLGRSRAMNGVTNARSSSVTTSSFLRAKLTSKSIASAVSKTRSSNENKENIRPS